MDIARLDDVPLLDGLPFTDKLAGSSGSRRPGRRHLCVRPSNAIWGEEGGTLSARIAL